MDESEREIYNANLITPEVKLKIGQLRQDAIFRVLIYGKSEEIRRFAFQSYNITSADSSTLRDLLKYSKDENVRRKAFEISNLRVLPPQVYKKPIPECSCCERLVRVEYSGGYLVEHRVTDIDHTGSYARKKEFVDASGRIFNLADGFPYISVTKQGVTTVRDGMNAGNRDMWW